jgi:tetratricopeptide (TPR) repeat protein
LWLNIAAADMALHAYADGAKGCVAALRHGGPSAKAAARLSNALCQVGAVEAATAVLDWGFTLDDAAAHGNQLSEARRLSSHLSAATSLMESMAGQPAQGHHAAAYADDAAQRLFDAAPSAPYAERLLLGLAEALLASGRLAAAGGLAASVLQQRGAGAVQGALVDPLDVSGVAGLSGAFADGRVAPPALPSAVALLAASHALRGDFGPAVATLERALPADPDGTTQEGREVQQLLKGLRRASERREQGTNCYAD